MDTRYTTALEVGEVFEFDLLDNYGVVVLPAGSYVSRAFLEQLEESGCMQVFAAPVEEVTEELAGQSVFKEYNASHQRALNALAEDSSAILGSIAERLFAGERVTPEPIDTIVDGYEQIVANDADVVLASILHAETDRSVVAHRSLRMCAIAIVSAFQMGYSQSDRRQLGRAALLHDICLPDNWPSLLGSLAGRYEAASHPLQNYTQHPFSSADLVRAGFSGASDLELTLITQVHEQCDGSGFPRGLKRHILHPLSRLLNVADAFLSLTDNSHPSGGYMAADALAYLVLHSLYGTFDRDCIQAVIRSAAVYPVGSEVRLSNSEVGTVMRSKKGDYLRPIIRLHSTTETVDLSSSPYHIIEPAQPHGKRLPKSLMNRTLWRPV